MHSMASFRTYKAHLVRSLDINYIHWKWNTFMSEEFHFDRTPNRTHSPRFRSPLRMGDGGMKMSTRKSYRKREIKGKWEMMATKWVSERVGVVNSFLSRLHFISSISLFTSGKDTELVPISSCTLSWVCFCDFQCKCLRNVEEFPQFYVLI